MGEVEGVDGELKKAKRKRLKVERGEEDAAVLRLRIDVGDVKSKPAPS